MSTAAAHATRIDHRALALLGWICAIGTTGASLSAISLVDASRSMSLTTTMEALSAGAVALTIAATAVPLGLLADRIGRRRLLLAALILTAAANLFIALVPSSWAYLTGLYVCGLGYAVLGPSAYAYVKRVVSGQSLGHALGLFGVYIALITFVTNLIGSAVVDLGWQWLFVIVPVMCALALLATPRVLPSMPITGSGSIDWWGIVLLALAVICVIGGLGRLSSPSGPWLGLLGVATGAVLFVAWLLVESRRASPLLPVRLLRRPLFLSAMGIGILMNAVLGAAMLGLSDLLQYAQADDASTTALRMQPCFLVGSLGGLIAGWYLSHRHPARRVVAVGLLVSAVGFALLALAHQDTPYLLVLPGMLLAGMGLMAGLTGQAQVFLIAAPAGHYGPITSLKTTVNQVGGALGMVLSVVLIRQIAASDVDANAAAAGLPPADVTTAQQMLTAFVQSGQPPRGLHATQFLRAATESIAAAYDAMMIGSAVACTLAAIVAWVWMRQPEGDGAASTAS